MEEKTREHNVKFNSLLVKESENRDYYRSIAKEINDVYTGIISKTKNESLAEKIRRDLKSTLSVT